MARISSFFMVGDRIRSAAVAPMRAKRRVRHPMDDGGLDAQKIPGTGVR
jgi:hypothetical protein